MKTQVRVVNTISRESKKHNIMVGMVGKVVNYDDKLVCVEFDAQRTCWLKRKEVVVM